MSLRALLLADEFFLAAHDDVTGKPRQHPRAIGLGLAGALLGELMLVHHITIQDGLVVVVNRRPPHDALAHTVLDHLTAERQLHNLRTWLAFLGQTATERVAGRLERVGHVTRTELRRLLKTEVRWVPTDMSMAASPGALLRHVLSNEKPLAVHEAALAGLIDAAGLNPTVLWGATNRTVQYRDWCVSALPEPLQDLIAEAKAAVGNTVLTHRT